MDKQPMKTFGLLKIFDEKYKQFLDSPTNKNFQLIINLGEQYKESWIEDMSNSDITRQVSSSDLDPHAPLNKEYEDFLADDPSRREKYLKTMDLEEKLWDAPTESMELADNDAIKNRVYTKEEMTADIDEMHSQIEKSSNLSTTDKKSHRRSGPDRLMSRTIAKHQSPSKEATLLSRAFHLPEGRYGPDERPFDELSYVQHAIRGARFDKDNRPFNRRWYIETGSDGIKSPWWCDRDVFADLVIEANNKAMFQKSLDDVRTNNREVIFSESLSDKDYVTYLNQITLPEERNSLLNNEEIHFVIVDTNYPKAPSQICDDDFLAANHRWRDVCIFGVNKITYRSLTTDKLFKPSIFIPDNPEWVLSNDMCHTSNQVLKEFIKYTNPGLKIKDEL